MRPTFMLVECCMLSPVCGCSSDPGSMTQGEVEDKLKGTLNLKAVSLTARPEGGYTGTGQATDGTSYAITVDQKQADRSLRYSATSDKGELKAGAFQEFGPSWLRPLTQARNGIMVILALIVVIGVGIVVARKLNRRTKHAVPGTSPVSDGG